MSSRQLRFLAFAAACLTALVLAACSTTRLSQPTNVTTDTSGGQCAAGQIPIPGGPPDSPTFGGSTATNVSTSGGVTTSVTITQGDPQPVFGSSIVPVNGTWTATDDSQTCGCAIDLTETQPSVSGNVSARGCQSSWLRQAVHFEFRNDGDTVAFFGGSRSTVLFELQRNGPNLMVGFAFGQRITIFRGS